MIHVIHAVPAMAAVQNLILLATVVRQSHAMPCGNDCGRQAAQVHARHASPYEQAAVQ
jgi:hypothetical protein